MLRFSLFALIILAIITLSPPATIQYELIPAKPEVKQQVTEPSRGARTLVMTATAYCYTGNRTYTGTWPEEGRTIAVDPKVISLGEEVYITCDTWPEVNGWYIAEDVGGAIRGYRIDIYMNDRNTCLQFGRRPVEAKVGRE